MLQRARPALGPGSGPQKETKKKKKLPKLEDFLQARDYTGAIYITWGKSLQIAFMHTFFL